MINPDDATVTLPLGFLDAMAQAESVETVMSTAVRWLPQMVPAVRASGYFFDDGRVIHSAHWTTDSTDAPEFARAPEHLLDALGDTHHHVNLDAKTLADSEAPALRYLYRTGIRSLLVVPMVLGSEALGMLTIGTDTPQPYGKQHGQTLKIIGNCIAAQIQLMLQFRKTVRLAETDPLTGLANRTRLMRVLNGGGDSLHLADADGRQLALLHIDLDHFKAINDRLGHAAGDGLLCRVTKRMSRAVGPKDLIARVGGDEFIVVTRSDPGGQHVIELGHAVINALKTPFEIEGMKARIGASIGTTLATEPGVTATRLIANADLALYAAKASGRSRVRPYTPALRSANERRSQIMADLRAALEEEDAFDVFFQPVIDLETGEFSSFEMLARWRHPKLGLLEPLEFLDLAKEAGLSDTVDRNVRRKGLAALAELRQQGWHMPSASFNASFGTLADPELISNLKRDVEDFGLVADDLALELREKDIEALGKRASVQTLAALTAAGYAVHLDDFSAGLTSMTMLGYAPLDVIKLDAVLIARLPEPRALLVLEAAIRLAHDLRLKVVAEGVETVEQFSCLKQIGCDYAQGFGIAPPMPMPELEAFMRSYGKAPIWISQAQRSA